MENEPLQQEPMDPNAAAQPLPSGIIREISAEQTVARRALVREWQDRVIRAKKHWEAPHKRMREDMDFLMGKQWHWHSENDDRYVANLVQRHVQQRVASLYAKNPKAIAKRRAPRGR
jgi:hypothetical protein